MIVNLHDSNFSQSVCSTAYQQPQYIEYVRGLRDFDGVTLFTDEWINNPIVDQVKSKYKIGWLREPYCLHPDTYQAALLNRHKFDFILTYYEPFLSLEPEKRASGEWAYLFKFAPYGGTWVAREEWGIRPKTKLCSMLIGSKMSTEGHRLRHEIADMLERAKFPVDFYGNRGLQTDYSQKTKLAVLADYHYSIVTETCREDNLFTEWLLDCFAAGAIPVFWGAPNIGDFFNSEGIASFANLRELLTTLPYLTVENYDVVSGAVEDNLQRMGDYAVTEDWLYLNVLKDLE